MKWNYSTTSAVSIYDLDVAETAMSAALNDYFANGLDVESIEHWAQDGAAKVRRNRQQFVALFPSLAPMLALRPNDPFSDEICRALDSGDELVKTIAQEFDVSRSTVRHLRHVPWSIAMAGRQRDEMDLLGCLEFIPQEHLPRTESDWLSLWILIDSIGFSSVGPVGHVVSDLCRRGYDNAYQLAFDVTDGDFFRLGDLHDYFGFVQRWAETLLGKLGYSKRSSQDSATVFLSGYRFPALWRQSEQWHEVMLDPAVASTLSLHELRWNALLPNPFHTNGLIITSLCSANELRTDGQEMEHCVATYASRCLSGESIILSIHTPTGKRLSTVEISLADGGNGMLAPAVVQHRGYRNGDPPDDAKNALADLLTFCRTPEAQAWLKLSFGKSRELADTMISFDQDQYSLIPWESCVLVMRRIFTNYGHCVAKLERIAGEVGSSSLDGPLRGNPILHFRVKRRFAQLNPVS